MKKTLFVLLFLSFLTGCSNDNAPSNNYDSGVALNLTDVAYGNDSLQKLDIYLPAGRDASTKVVILIHGGFWVEGDKADFTASVPIIQEQFPDFAVVNINYRLASLTSPAIPKQIDDIALVLKHLKTSGYNISANYALIGTSAGGHLAMLYGYKYDTQGEIKAICDIVGPADFSDPAYLSHPLYPSAALALLGTQTPTQAQIDEVSPTAHITAQSAPTLSFYGGTDPLVPPSQGPRLKAKLDEAGVYNEFNFFPNGGHADWDDATNTDVYAKITTFLQNHFN